MNLVGAKIGNYVVKQELGAGGMGTVYLCEHALIGRKVARSSTSASPSSPARRCRRRGPASA